RDALAELRPHPAHRYRDPEVLLARAWVAAAEGAVGEGATLAREAASIAATCELPTQEIGALHAAVRFGDATVAERLTVLASAAQCPIAGTLVVSVRTVEGHIYHACTKLGVTDRSALAETLGLGRSTPSR